MVDNIKFELKSKEELLDIPRDFKNHFFYIGVTQYNDSSEYSVRQRGIGQNHHIDTFMNRLPNRIFCTYKLSRENVCQLEKEMIEKYKQYENNLNINHGNDNCITSQDGVCYIRIYNK